MPCWKVNGCRTVSITRIKSGYGIVTFCKKMADSPSSLLSLSNPSPPPQLSLSFVFSRCRR